MTNTHSSPVKSMTGFGSAAIAVVNAQLSVEIRGINHRYFDFYFRAPEHLRFTEPIVREACQTVVRRGRCEVLVRWRESGAGGDDLRIDNTVVDQLARVAHETQQRHPHLTPMSIADVIAWPGVTGTEKVSDEQLQRLMKGIVDEALGQLDATRIKEGGRLVAVMRERLEVIAKHSAAAAKRIPHVQKEYRSRLNEQLNKVRQELDGDRVEQEMVLFANRIDVTEEIDRLGSHQKAFAKAIKDGGVVGRRLDFLLQEINREVNTLASKSTDVEQTNHAVEMKVLIEQIREQVQNIE